MDTLEQLGVLAIAVGNTRTRFGVFVGRELRESHVLPNSDPAAIVAAILRSVEGVHNPAVALGSVNQPISDKLIGMLDGEQGMEVQRIGADLHAPMKHSLDDASTLGVDRILCAYGAWKRAEQAVVIVDAGTAITVDFVDGEGTFHGGIIAPGLNLMLRSLHEHTAALPGISFESPDPARGPFGKDTRHAMLLGAQNAARGLVRYVTELYAEKFEAYPQIIATGGDAPTLFENDDVIESIVPDLQLIGILETVRAQLED